jgi:hypothetical protein
VRPDGGGAGRECHHEQRGEERPAGATTGAEEKECVAGAVPSRRWRAASDRSSRMRGCCLERISGPCVGTAGLLFVTVGGAAATLGQGFFTNRRIFTARER